MILLTDFDTDHRERWPDFFLIFTRYSTNIKIGAVQYAFLLQCVFYNCIKQVETVPFLILSYCCKLLE